MMQGGAPFHKANKNALGEWVVYRFLLSAGLKRAFSGLYVSIDPRPCACGTTQHTRSSSV